MEVKQGDILIALKPCYFSQQERTEVGKEYEVTSANTKTFAIKVGIWSFARIDMFCIGEYFKIKESQTQTERLKEIHFLIMRAYENGQKVELSLISELLNIIK